MLIPIGVSSYFLALPFRLLHTYASLSNVCPLPFAEMEVAKQRVLVRVSAAACKQKEEEGASTSTPKVVGKGMSKQKSKGKDDHSLKKGLGTPASDKQSKQPLPPKLGHGAGKGLMTATGPIT